MTQNPGTGDPDTAPAPDERPARCAGRCCGRQSAPRRGIVRLNGATQNATWSSVSRLSHGRLVVGTGVGVDESGDFTGFGDPTDLATRSAMLTEGLTMMRAMWAGEAVRHSGRHYRVQLAATET